MNKELLDVIFCFFCCVEYLCVQLVTANLGSNKTRKDCA